MIKGFIKLFVISSLFFVCSSIAASYSGKVGKLQVGDGVEAGLDMNGSYLMVTLNPLPIIDSCSTDASKRLIIDSSNELGRLMFSMLLAAKAASQNVSLISVGNCISHTNGSVKWEEIKMIVVD